MIIAGPLFTLFEQRIVDMHNLNIHTWNEHPSANDVVLLAVSP